MTMHRMSTVIASTTAALALISSGAFAQTVTGGTSGGVQGKGVTASTYGAGERTSTPTGTSTGISGGGAASAADGTASTDANAQVNDRRAKMTSTATAYDQDERARSRTRTMVLPNDTVRSKTMSRYKARGEKPVREMSHTVSTPDGTNTKSK